ncbi:MAG: nuclear transport factor 2 family protein, partial [Candidatus Dormibacteria bacterium]
MRTFVDAWHSRDPDALARILAADVVLWSPIIESPFRGREAARELYEILFEAFGDVNFHHQSQARDVYALAWSGELNGQPVTGAELLRVDQRGQIAEITAYIRPLAGLAVFAAAIGPRLASRHGRFRVPALAVMGAVLRGVSKV